MEDQVCPRCRTTKYRNPSLKLLVNVCGHSLCDNCVELLFLKGSGSCPECQIPLRRSNFRVQLFEDPMVEKEVDIRRRVLREYNKKEEDFADVALFNDYLEEIETIVYNLANGIDIVETNKRIEAYKRDNKEITAKNKMKLSRYEIELEELLEAERDCDASLRSETTRDEVETKKRKIALKEALIDELMFTEKDARSIVKTFAEAPPQVSAAQSAKTGAKETARAVQFSTGIRIGMTQDYLMPVKIEEAPLFAYTTPVYRHQGPPPPSWEDLTDKGYRVQVRREGVEETAGGFDCRVSCFRALQEALNALYYSYV